MATRTISVLSVFGSLPSRKNLPPGAYLARARPRLRQQPNSRKPTMKRASQTAAKDRTSICTRVAAILSAHARAQFNT
eukprot:3349918-Lingulodinium_polyedra.AAC.1